MCDTNISCYFQSSGCIVRKEWKSHNGEEKIQTNCRYGIESSHNFYTILFLLSSPSLFPGLPSSISHLGKWFSYFWPPAGLVPIQTVQQFVFPTNSPVKLMPPIQGHTLRIAGLRFGLYSHYIFIHPFSIYLNITGSALWYHGLSHCLWCQHPIFKCWFLSPGCSASKAVPCYCA